MRKLLLGLMVAASAAVLTAGIATAGLNAGATCRLYWQNGTNGTALAARDNVAAAANLLVTVKGVNNFQGSDVQIVINALDGNSPPAAWQFQTGGCADGAATFNVGGKGGATFKNIFSTAPAVAGVIPTQNGMSFNTLNCNTPNHVGLLWLSAAGAAGQARTAATEYGVWSINFDLTALDPADGVTPCAGGAADPAGAKGVCLNLNFRVPCNGPQQVGAIQLLDNNLAVDFATGDNGFTFITWNVGVLGSECPKVTPVGPTTWGKLKKSYR